MYFISAYMSAQKIHMFFRVGNVRRVYLPDPKSRLRSPGQSADNSSKIILANKLFQEKMLN